MNETTYSAFDGQVTFAVSKPTLRGLVIEDALRGAVGQVGKGTDTERLIENLALFLDRTKGMTFNLPEEPHPSALAFQLLWTVAQTGDLKATWEAFLNLDLDEHNAWLDALRAGNRAGLNAPPDVQPNADDEAVSKDPLDEPNATG